MAWDVARTEWTSLALRGRRVAQRTRRFEPRGGLSREVLAGPTTDRLEFPRLVE